MSSPTWTPAALQTELRPYERRVWRVVELQYAVSTRKIVDSNVEHEWLEMLVRMTEPDLPRECWPLHDLLSWPFHSRPSSMGSRFRRAGVIPGVFYAAEESRTAVAEKAFYRLLFFAELPATPWPANPSGHTAFTAAVRTSRSLDLTQPPLDADKALWSHPVEYDPCQAVADTAREIGAEILRYESVRDPQGGSCVAILNVRPFRREPRLTGRLGK